MMMMTSISSVLVADVQVVQANTKSADTKSVEKSARIAALDYLGTVASRLRKDAIAVSIDQNAVNDVISVVRGMFCITVAVHC